MASHYQVSDEDVEGVVNYMRLFHPGKADPEYCRDFLEALYAGTVPGVGDVAIDHPSELEELYEKYESYLQSIINKGEQAI